MNSPKKERYDKLISPHLSNEDGEAKYLLVWKSLNWKEILSIFIIFIVGFFIIGLIFYLKGGTSYYWEVSIVRLLILVIIMSIIFQQRLFVVTKQRAIIFSLFFIPFWITRQEIVPLTSIKSTSASKFFLGWKISVSSEKKNYKMWFNPNSLIDNQNERFAQIRSFFDKHK